MAHRLLRLAQKIAVGPRPDGEAKPPEVEPLEVEPLSGSEFCVTETVAEIVAAHRSGELSPAQTVARSYQRIRDHNDPAIFVSLRYWKAPGSVVRRSKARFLAAIALALLQMAGWVILLWSLFRG